MATNNHQPVTMETPVSVRVSIHGTSRKFKIPLGDLNAQALPGKLRSLLGVAENQAVIFERFSDTAGAYVTLDPANTHVYKTLFRAAKAKLKLRLRATIPGEARPAATDNIALPIGLPGTFGTAMPDFGRGFGSETTLNATAEPATLRVQASAETLVTVVNGSDVETPIEKVNRTIAENLKAMGKAKADAADFAAPIKPAVPVSFQRERDLVVRLKEALPTAPSSCTWSVFCNACDKPMANEHYHCNICDDGDYDLCEECVNSGKHCSDADHWLVKRTVKDGECVSSTTERIRSKIVKCPEAKLPEMPGAFTEAGEEKKVEQEIEEEAYEPLRTCNCCVKELHESKFITCLNCEDYDLCFDCHEDNKHGHHPAHEFKPVAKDVTLTPLAEFLCAKGRNIKHNALCDGCDKPIFGVRHKCLECPDWDYCKECFKNAPHIHPAHRFAPLYEQLASPRYRKARHVGIYCDGPLCESKGDYIEGVRYKCAICHDTDFCANCEAYPHNKHNHTHPLIQFKTPVRNATITTAHEDPFGNHVATRGDRRATRTEPSRSPTNAATQVQTIIDFKPAEVPAPAPRVTKEKIEIKDLLATPIHEKIKVADLLSSPVEEKQPLDITKLKATFVRETVVDGTIMAPGQSFTQIWTIKNSGRIAWPAGCSVRYTGGDNMLIDMVTESNVASKSVQADEEIAFVVSMRAPLNTGTKVSYWRLKTADGQAFGDRLWCHVSVSSAPEKQLANPLPQVAATESEGAAPASWNDNYLQQALQHRLEQTRLMQKERMDRQKQLQDRFKQQAAEAEAKANRGEMLRKLSDELHVVGTQQKARMAAAKAAIDAAHVAKKETVAPAPVSELPAAAAPAMETIHKIAQAGPYQSPAATADLTRQLQLLEMQNKQRLQMALANQRLAQQKMMGMNPQAGPAPAGQASSSQPVRNQALQDYQMQHMLLQQQMMKRMHASRVAAVHGAPIPVMGAPIPLVRSAHEDVSHGFAAVKKEQEQIREAMETMKPVTPQRPVEVEAPTVAVKAELKEEAKAELKEEIKAEPTEGSKAEEKSTMIFPKLDKESPVSSTHDVASIATAKEVQSPVSEKEQIFADAETLDFEESSEEDEGFMTDEEYDILDASDEETFA